MRMLRSSAACAFLVAWSHTLLWAQVVRDTEPARVPAVTEVIEHMEEEKQFVMRHVPPLQKLNGLQDRFDEICPLKFGVEASFLSDWLDEGADAAKKGLQIQQVYFTELTHEVFDGAEAGVGFEYFQIDTTGAYEGPSTLERDFTIYAPLTWKRFSLQPSWTYVYIDGGDDSGEIGAEFSIEMPLHPTFAWNYDYDDVKGNWFEWNISQDFDIPLMGEKLATFTPSVTLGMDNRKAFDHTGLANIDFGLDLEVPLTGRFAVVGLLHFSKSLNDARNEDGSKVFEDIIPWGGLSIVMEL
jgi:hypothetical protein